jgi:hypothetical protein
MRYIGLLVAFAVVAGCGKTLTETVRVTETQTTTLVKRIAAPREAVFVPDREGELVYRPAVIDLSDSAAITHIRWGRYGGGVAIGRGTFPLPGCEPACATGKIFWVGVTVTLKNRGLCRGRIAYRWMELEGPGFKTRDPISAVIHPTRKACKG